MANEILPSLVTYLDELKRRQEIHVTDTTAAAGFIINGQVGILNDLNLPIEKRFQLIQELAEKIVA